MAADAPTPGLPSQPPAHWPARLPPPPPSPPPSPRGGAAAIIAAAVVITLVITYGLGQALVRADDPRGRVAPATFPESTTTAPVEGLVPLEQAVPALISFVEQQRGSRFDPPPDVLPQSDLTFATTAATVAGGDAPLARHAVTYEALGITDDLSVQMQQLAARTSVAVFDPVTGSVFVRGEMTTPYTRANIVFALTQALDRQLPPASSPDASRYDESFAEETLAAGSATVVAAAYVSRLNQADQASFEQDQRQVDGLRAASGTGDVARFLDIVPSLAGRQLVLDIMGQPGGPQAVDRAFASPPTTTEQAFDSAAYEQSEPALTLSRLEPPAGRVLDSGRFGLIDVMVALYPGIDVPVERGTADWGGGRFQTWRGSDGELCIEARVAGDSETQTFDLLNRFDEWADRVGADPAQGIHDPALGRTVVALRRCA